MRFWDTSALVPLLLEQESTRTAMSLLQGDPDIAAWWGTVVECSSAAARLRREEVISPREEERVLAALHDFREAWLEVLPSEEMVRRAQRILRVHALKAADALQLAAAGLWSGDVQGAELVTFDERLRLAARLEGFRVLPGD